MNSIPAKETLDAARSFVRADIHQFSEFEERVLRQFFTNTRKRVFFMHMLPANVGASLLAMYSRMKNPRGIRGTFVDRFLPSLLGLMDVADDEKEVPAVKTASLQEFTEKFPDGQRRLAKFLRRIVAEPDYLRRFSQSRHTRKFLDTWLDAYGHNSIARGGSVWLCFENISILAAKSIEWGRPGAAYIELSTRYVDMNGKGAYPIENELSLYSRGAAKAARALVEHSFGLYREWQGENFSGPFPRFLRERYGALYERADLERGVIGETCDVLGNFLPASTLTSVGCSVSGEALPELVKHLLLDATPENEALAELVRDEAEKCGASQFLRHVEPTPWKRASWEYLDTAFFESAVSASRAGEVVGALVPSRDEAEKFLLAKFRLKERFCVCADFDSIVRRFGAIAREKYDKLPNEFEAVSADFWGVMSFRGWRDVHRMGMSTHARTYLTPDLGFYQYDKPAPAGFPNSARNLHRKNYRVRAQLAEAGIPDAVAQYPLALGNRVGFTMGSNLAQWEFCLWQRSDHSVNHEVRRFFLAVHKLLSEEFPWWSDLVRVDTTNAYVFARPSKVVPLSDAERKLI